MDMEELRRHQILMRGFDAEWCFGGGWACDGWLGRISRPHADVDVVIWRRDQLLFRAAFAGWQWQTFSNGLASDWPLGTRLELPYHNAHGVNGGLEFEVLMGERDLDEWWYRRNPLIRMPASRVMLRSSLGFRVLNPAIALLFKSKQLHQRDRHDFNAVLPALETEDRRWLRHALTVAHPQHEWIDCL